MLEVKSTGYTPADLLAMIELDRYCGGKCNGKYTSRLHYLEDHIDADVGPIAENVAQLSEKVRAIARQFLTRCASATLSRCPRSEIRSCAAFSFFSEAPSASSSAAICRRSAPICSLRFWICASARAVACFSRRSGLGLSLSPGPAAGAWPLPARSLSRSLCAALSDARELGDLILKAGLAGPLQRKQLT